MGHVNETYNFDISAHENLKLNYVTRNALKFKHDHLKKNFRGSTPARHQLQGVWTMDGIKEAEGRSYSSVV